MQKEKVYQKIPEANKMFIKGIVSRDWKGLQIISLDRFEV
jgi:hypothetical protein